MTKYNIFGFEIEKKTMQMIIEFALLVAVMVLAYNIGHYDSLQYQAMFEQCRNQEINFTGVNETFLNN